MNKVEIKKLISGTKCSPEMFEQLTETGGLESAIAYVKALKGEVDAPREVGITVGFLNQFTGTKLVRDKSTGKDTAYKTDMMRFKLGIPRSDVAGSPLEKQCEGEWLLLTGVFQPNKRSAGFNIGQDFVQTREQANKYAQAKADRDGRTAFVIHDWMQDRVNGEPVEVE